MEDAKYQGAPKPPATYKIVLYRRELARKEQKYFELSRAKVELTALLLSAALSGSCDYKKDELLRRTLHNMLFKQKLTYDVAKHAAKLENGKELDKNTLKKCAEKHWNRLRRKRSVRKMKEELATLKEEYKKIM